MPAWSGATGVHRPRPAGALQGVAKSKNAVEVPLDKIVPDPDQPREEFDPEALERLADSLKARGQLQPIRVRWDEARSKYVLICGERRWRAARIAEMTTMSCVVSEGPLDAGELLALQLVENCLREDLQPIEQARAFKALMDKNGWSGNQTAKALGIAQPTVVRALALLELPGLVQDQVEQGTLAPATAYEIGKVEDPETQQEIAARVVSEHLSRSEAIEAVRAASGARRRNRARAGEWAGPGRYRPPGRSRRPAVGSPSNTARAWTTTSWPRLSERLWGKSRRDDRTPPEYGVHPPSLSRSWWPGRRSPRRDLQRCDPSGRRRPRTLSLTFPFGPILTLGDSEPLSSN